MKLFALIAVVLMSGCATTQRMDIKDLNTMQIDCANKDAQIRFLESQMTTPNERMLAVFGMSSISESLAAAAGNKTQQRSIRDREYDAIAKKLIWDLRAYCPSVVARAQ